jgi:hypothetical protein
MKSHYEYTRVERALNGRGEGQWRDAARDQIHPNDGERLCEEKRNYSLSYSLNRMRCCATSPLSLFATDFSAITR